MNNTKLSLLAAILAAFSQCAAFAHAPVTFKIPLHHASSNATFSPLHNVTKNTLVHYPVSGAASTFAQTIKNITAVSLKNTVLNAPLSDISGQFNGALYGKASDGVAGYYGALPAFLPFGNTPANGGTFLSNGVINNLSNSISKGLPNFQINMFSGTIGGRPLPISQRSLQSYYNQAASNGYNLGIKALQNPTGGLLFGTTYYGYNNPNFQSYPGFFAFGNNPYASTAITMQSYTSNSVYLSQAPASYIQFGNIIRPISNGFVLGTGYEPAIYAPPYGVSLPGSLFTNYGRFGIAIGSNPLNIEKYSVFKTIPFDSPTFFK